MNFQVDILKEEEQFLQCKIFSLTEKTECFATFVYDKCTRRERYELWNGINSFSVPLNSPWCVGGDLNIISTPSEREGGSLPNLNCMNYLSYCINDNNLIDIGFKGNPFTWEKMMV